MSRKRCWRRLVYSLARVTGWCAWCAFRVVIAIDVKSVTKTAVTVLFNLGTDLVKDATYYRPPSYNPRTGTVMTGEVTAGCKILVGAAPRRQFGDLVIDLD